MRTDAEVYIGSSSQDGNAIVGEILDLLVPAGRLKVGIAPRVVILKTMSVTQQMGRGLAITTHKSKEIAPLIVRPTVHIIRQLHPIVRHIGRRVSHWHAPVFPYPHILLHIPRRRLHVPRCLGTLHLVIDDLVPREKRQRIVVLCKRIDRRKDALQVLCVVRGGRIEAVD